MDEAAYTMVKVHILLHHITASRSVGRTSLRTIDAVVRDRTPGADQRFSVTENDSKRHPVCRPYRSRALTAICARNDLWQPPVLRESSAESKTPTRNTRRRRSVGILDRLPPTIAYNWSSPRQIIPFA